MKRFYRMRWCRGVVMVLLVLPVTSRAAEQVALQAADGFPVQGIYEQVTGPAAARPAVVLLHMYNRQKEDWQPLMAALKGQGISSLAIDLRGHGASRLDAAGIDQSFRVVAREAAFFNEMYQDGLAALRWLQGQGHRSLGVVGASVGCSVAMHMVAAANPKIAAVVLMTPGLDYLGIDTLGHLESWPGIPLLIMTSEEEAGRGAAVIYERLQSHGAELVVFKQQAVHGTMMFAKVPGVEERISRWLTRQLRP